MTLRTITDADGTEWKIWEVIPGSPRLSGPPTGTLTNVWGRTAQRNVPVVPSSGRDTGWLVFMNDVERRRLAPIPPGWAMFEDAQLLGLLHQAMETNPAQLPHD